MDNEHSSPCDALGRFVASAAAPGAMIKKKINPSAKRRKDEEEVRFLDGPTPDVVAQVF